MSITKDSKEWLAALQFAKKWEPNQVCEYLVPRDGHMMHVAPCGSEIYGGGWLQHGPHDIPPPNITPDLLYAIRRAIDARGYQWILKFSPEFGYIFFIYRHDGEQVSNSQYAETEDGAIIRAAASLQEAK
jgi:hypothetical protein